MPATFVDTDTGVIAGEADGQALALLDGHFQFMPTGLMVQGDPTFEEWEECGLLLSHIQKRIHWWIGDWLAYGERRWGETYAQAVDPGRFSDKTLANDKWVASRVPTSLRKENLSFTHHALVAPLEPEEQARLLDKAEEEDLSTRELHREVKRVQHLRKNNPHRKIELHVDAAFIVTEDKVEDFKSKAREWGGNLASLEGVNCIDFIVERA